MVERSEQDLRNLLTLTEQVFELYQWADSNVPVFDIGINQQEHISGAVVYLHGVAAGLRFALELEQGVPQEADLVHRLLDKGARRFLGDMMVDGSKLIDPLLLPIQSDKNPDLLGR